MSISSLLFERARNHLHLHRERARLAQAFSLPRGSGRSAKARRGSLSVMEQLEARTLLAATWTPLNHLAPGSVTAMYLLPDGRVLAQGGSQQISNRWEILTPDAQGSYANGTWSNAASSNEARLYYSSQILQDGRLFIAGSEYDENFADPPFQNPTRVTKDAEIYDPQTNSWTVLPTQNFGALFDCASEILPDGNVLMVPVDPVSPFGTIIYNPNTNQFIAGPAQLRGINQANVLSGDEEGLVKLPDNSILTVDGAHTSERYIPSQNRWVNDGTVPVNLYDVASAEIGAGVLLPNGKVFWTGGTGKTAIYTPSGSTAPGTWTAGPNIPSGNVAEDAPATVLPDGKVLFLASASEGAPGIFYLYNPTTNSISRAVQPGYSDSPFVNRFLNLPDGTILTSHNSQQLNIYNPNTTALPAAAPVLAGFHSNPDGTFTATGTNFNGINEGSSYGDDAQMATNYPLVRLTSGTNVYYARSWGWNLTGVMTGSQPTSTNFVLPAGLPLGIYQMQVVTNGVASNSVTFVNRPGAVPTLVFTQQPTGGLPLRALPSFNVTIEDQFGDIYTGFTSNITLSVASGPGTIGGTFTVAAVNGVATFSNVTLSAAGTYTLAASDPADGVSNVLSDPFTVQPGPTQLVFTTQPGTSQAGQPIAGPVTVSLEFANGTVVDDNTTITLAVASGPGSLNGNITIPLVHGVATFSDANITVAGSYTLSATDALDGITGTSNSFLVQAASPAQLVYLQQPSNGVAGQAISPGVAIALEDAYGNINSNLTVPITITPAGPGAAGGTTTVSTVNGVATFSNLVFTTAGNYTLTAQDNNKNFTATSGAFAITPAAASTISFVQAPSSITAGQQFSPAISVVLTDAFGNVVTNDVSNVTIATATGPGAVVGTSTVGVTGGTATFSDLTINKSGTYTLVVTDGSVTPLFSGSFDVISGPAAQAVFVQQPGAMTNGGKFNLTMQIEDSAGNFLPNSNVPVHLSLVGAPVGSKLNGNLTARAVNGIVTMHNINISRSGYFTLGSTINGFPTAYSSPIVVSGTPTKLAVSKQPPATVAAGTALSNIVVHILDQFGNVAATNSAVTVSLVGPNGAVLGGPKTVHAVNGVVSFTNLTISRAGNYTLRFTDGSLTAATSRTINVSGPLLAGKKAAGFKKKVAVSKKMVAVSTKTALQLVRRSIRG